MTHRSFKTIVIFIIIAFFSGCKKSEKPTADDQHIEIQEETQASITLTGSVSDSSPLTFQITKPPAYGQLSGNMPNLVYTPHPGLIGHDEFTFVAQNGTASSDEAIIKIDVAPNMAALSGKPTPVFIKVAYPISTTEIHIEWSQSSDNTTTADSIAYEIHVSQSEDFFPSNTTLKDTVIGDLEADLSGFNPGTKIFAKVIAVDSTRNRSLETSPTPISVASDELQVRDDIDIFLADDHFRSPQLDAQGQTLSFQRVSSELPTVGSYLLLNTDEDAAIFRVKAIEDLTPTQVTLQVAGADVGDLFQAGDLNLTLGTSSLEDAGWRWDWDWGTSTIGEFPWENSIQFDCADSYGNDAQVALFDVIPSGIRHADAGVEIGCNMSIEIKNTYAFNTAFVNSHCPGQLPDIDPFVIKRGSVHVLGTYSLKPYMNLGYAIPVTLARANLWQRDKPIERSIVRKISIRGMPIPIRLTIQAWPKIDWNLAIEGGQDVDIVTESRISGRIDSTVHYERQFYANSPCIPDFAGYTYDFQQNRPSQFDPEFGSAIVKSDTAANFRIENNFLAGVGINLKHLERISLTAGMNIGFVLKGEIREREDEVLLSAPINASPLEVRSLEFNLETSLKAIGSAKVIDLDLPWWLTPLDSLYTLRWTPIDIPLPEIPIINTPHLDLEYHEITDTDFELVAVERFGSGSWQDVIRSELEWHILDFDSEFTLTPDANATPPKADGVWKSEAKNLAAALEYLPSITEGLLDRHSDFKEMMTKYAVHEIEDCSPLILNRYVVKNSNTTPNAPKDCSIVKDIVTNLEWQR